MRFVFSYSNIPLLFSWTYRNGKLVDIDSVSSVLAVIIFHADDGAPGPRTSAAENSHGTNYSGFGTNGISLQEIINASLHEYEVTPI